MSEKVVGLSRGDAPVREITLLLRRDFDAAFIPIAAARLLFQHFPELVTFVCLGLAGHHSIIWLSMWVTNFSAFAAYLILPFAPLCVMLAMMFSLWRLQPSLPCLSTMREKLNELPLKSRLLSIGGVFLPFLTAYALHGMLREDVRTFQVMSINDDYFVNGIDTNWGRFVPGWALLAIMTVAVFLLRKVITYFNLQGRRLWLALLSSYLEVLWMMWAVLFALTQAGRLQSWALTRQGTAPLYYAFLDFKAGMSQHTPSFLAFGDWLIYTCLPALILLAATPAAWLTVGALVFGIALQWSPYSTGRHALSPTKSNTSRPSRKRVQALARAGAASSLDSSLQPQAGPIRMNWEVLRLLSREGLLTLSLFSIIFLGAAGLEIAVIELARSLVGPLQGLPGIVVADYIAVFARAVYLTILVCFVAASVELVARRLPPDHSPTTGDGNSSVKK